MASLKLIFYSFLYLFSIFNVVLSLYEDQIGKFDWKQSFIGNVKYGSFDSVKKVVVATDENVLASLHLKNGQIAWRHVLESPETNSIRLLNVDRDVITVSGDDITWFIRGWDVNSGALLWEWTLITEKNQNNRWVYYNDKIVHIVPVTDSHLEVTFYDSRSGRNNGKTSKISTPWLNDLSKCVTAGVYWSCISSNDDSGQLYYIDLFSENNKVYVHKIQSLIGSSSGNVEIKSIYTSDPVLLLICNSVARFIRLQPDLPRSYSYSLSPQLTLVNNEQKQLVFQFVKDSKDSHELLFRSVDLEDGSENTVLVDFKKATNVNMNVVNGICRGTSCRVLFRGSDNSLSLLQLPTGKVLWTREEALSNVVGAEFLELPVSEVDASIEHEFDSASNDIIGLLYHRLSSQFKQVSLFLSGQQSTSNNNLVRDDFGLHKIIVIATKVGKLFGIDSLSGNIIWSRYFANVKPFTSLGKEMMLLFVQRTARYSPLLQPHCSILMKDKFSDNGVIFSFDPITGEEYNKLEQLTYRVQQAMLLPNEDEEHLRGLLILSEDNQVNLYPSSSKSVLLKHASSTFLYTANTKTASLHGYNLAFSTEEKLKATLTWNVNLGQAELIALGVRPSMEKVHSQGRVLADRSVLYKYVNPNLLAVATLSDDLIHKHVLSVYLIDGITGLIVFSAIHKRANRPVHLVHSENWLVYSYYNERFRRVELASVELYEGSVQSNSTAFSSHSVSQLPHPEMQAYIFPATPLVIESTLTERGITNKHILVALRNGAVSEIPWAFLEPRNAQGPVNPEEGYIPYLPELPMPAEATINYNQSLARVRGIQVSPARLESTCLVLVHGLDLYYTRVTPSKTFDLLKEDFDHWLIAVVLIGLTVASYVTKHLASRKALKQAWK